ncbi:hypothetical protein CRM22_004502 [Opisthorchis felineus]|uniref:Uncharacterized protein n=1 Tax=Opisthorchis felineus TaxID=147828 RepID=A0A4S2LVV1_OPIFE|nr:hypothetical protein CRM22_004502 [Opisthorchis felineus]
MCCTFCSPWTVKKLRMSVEEAEKKIDLLEDRIARLLMEQEKSRSEKDKLLAQIHEQNMKLYHMQQVLESSESHTLEDLPDNTYPVTVEQPYDQTARFSAYSLDQDEPISVTTITTC